MRVHQGTVATDGAEIYYETRGAGPPVLIIQGGLSEAGATEQLADALAPEYLVISYDRRGLSRSGVVGPVPPVTMAGHAADAAALLASVSTRPALVIGASIGALIGLHLAVLCPGRVATLVAHEPPMATVVADPEREEVLDAVAALAREDVGAAIRRMAELTGSDRASAEAGARPVAPVGDVEANLHWFFNHDFPAVRGSALDSAAVAAVPEPTTVIPTGGVESRGQWEYHCAERLAERLGRTLTELPGGHNGLTSHPRAYATGLRRLFDGPER